MSAIIKFIDSIVDGIQNFFNVLSESANFFSNLTSIIPDFLKPFLAVAIPLFILIFILELL